MDARVKARQVAIGELPPDAPAFHRHRCRNCRRDLGTYALTRGDEGWTLAEGTAHWMIRPENRPRTGTGLSMETFAGRGKVRIHCKCGRDEELGIRKYLDLPVTVEGDELLVYL